MTASDRDRIVARFWTKVNKTDGCWLWAAGMRDNGYGCFAVTHRRQILAHRFSYEVSKGPIPLGYTIDHLCRVRSCVNPAHLEAVTQRENLMRGRTTQAAINASKTHCAHGHEFTPENTYVVGGRGRQCVTCQRGNEKRAYEKWKARRR